MVRDNIEELLSVHWYDGLLINELHFSHTDNRANRLFAETNRLYMRQSGIFDVDTSAGAQMKPVEISEVNHQEQTVEITFELPRTIKALTPGGQLLVAVQSRETRLGWPTQFLKVVLKKEDFPPGEYVVAARPETRSDTRVDYQVGRILQKAGIAAPSDEIGLTYPSVVLQLVETADYKANIQNTYADFVALGIIENTGSELKLRDGYIPPVAQLSYANSFGGDVESLSKLFDSLVTKVSRKRTEQKKTLVGAYDGELLFWAMDILILRTFLLTRMGLIKNLMRISAATLFFDVIYPLADWHEHYFTRAFGEENLPKFYARRPDVKGLTWEDLCIDTGPLLGRSVEQLQQIIEDID